MNWLARTYLNYQLRRMKREAKERADRFGPAPILLTRVKIVTTLQRLKTVFRRILK